MRLKKLKQRRRDLFDELYDLHYAEPTPAMYKMKRHEIEHEIACIEEAIEVEEMMLPFKYTFIGFIVIVIGMLIWAFAVSK